MTIVLPTAGVALPMSGTVTTEDAEPLLLASWYRLNPPLRRDGRNSIYAAVTPTGIWDCDWTGHITGYGHMLSQRHGTPDGDLALLGYPVQR